MRFRREVHIIEGGRKLYRYIFEEDKEQDADSEPSDEAAIYDASAPSEAPQDSKHKDSKPQDSKGTSGETRGR